MQATADSGAGAPTPTPAPRALIPNFWDRDPLEVEARAWREIRVVSVLQEGAGSMRLQHDMRPDQARHMAAALIAAADWLDARQVPA